MLKEIFNLQTQEEKASYMDQLIDSLNIPPAPEEPEEEWTYRFS